MFKGTTLLLWEQRQIIDGFDKEREKGILVFSTDESSVFYKKQAHFVEKNQKTTI